MADLQRLKISQRSVLAVNRVALGTGRMPHMTSQIAQRRHKSSLQIYYETSEVKKCNTKK